MDMKKVIKTDKTYLECLKIIKDGNCDNVDCGKCAFVRVCYWSECSEADIIMAKEYLQIRDSIPKKKYFKVTQHPDFEGLTGNLKDIMAIMGEDMNCESLEVGEQITFEVIEMTDEEFKNLEEFNI